MTFREKFLGAKHPCGEYRFGKGWVGFEPKQELLEELRGAIRELFESATERVRTLPGGAAFASEIQYQLKSLSKSGNESLMEWDGEEAHPPSELETADAIQRYCNYLGSQLCSIRWAAERRISERTLRNVSISMESLYRQDFQSGIRLYDTKEYTLARESFQKAVASCPTNYFAHQYLGLIAVHVDLPGEAVSHFETAFKNAETDTHRALALSHLARTHYALGDLDQASALARKAAELDDTAGFWYEFATYSALQGDMKPVLPAIINAMQKDWVFWAVAAVDPQLDPLRTEITTMMNDVRDKVGRKSKKLLEQLRELCDAMQKLGGMDTAPMQKELEDFEKRYAQNNIYIFRDLAAQLEAVVKRATRSAREAVHTKINARRRGLKKTEVWREEQVGQLAGPVRQLRQEQKVLGSQFKAWNAGCFTYTILWAVYTAFAAVFLVEPGASNFNVIVYLGGFLFPFLLPAIVNSFNFWVSVKKPRRSLDDRIHELEQKVNPEVESVEKEYSTRKAAISKELHDLEALMEQIRRTEVAA